MILSGSPRCTAPPLRVVELSVYKNIRFQKRGIPRAVAAALRRAALTV